MTNKMCGRSSNLDQMAQRWFRTTFTVYQVDACQIRVKPKMVDFDEKFVIFNKKSYKMSNFMIYMTIIAKK